MSITRKLYVGIDSHSQIHKVALIPVEAMRNSLKDLKKSELMDISNNISDFKRLSRSISKYVSLPNEVVIGIDTSGIYTLPLTYYLQNQNYEVYYMEQKSTKVSRTYLFDIENKSDVIDAISIAYVLYLKDLAGSLFRVTATRSPDLNSKAFILHNMILHRQRYNKLITQCTNRLHVFLAGIFPEAEKLYFTRLLRILPHYPTPKEISRSRGMKKIKGIGKTSENAIKELAKRTVGIPADNYRPLIRNLCQQREQAMIWKEEITELIKREVDEHPYGTILLSFPQLGYITAATIIGAIGDINQWSNDKKLKKAFGVYSSFRESGKYLNVHKQGRRGNRHCKPALFQAVCRCPVNSAPENDFRDYYNRKVSRGKPKISAVVATMGKLTELIYHCLKVSEPYCYKGIYKTRRGKY